MHWHARVTRWKRSHRTPTWSAMPARSSCILMASSRAPRTHAPTEQSQVFERFLRPGLLRLRPVQGVSLPPCRQLGRDVGADVPLGVGSREVFFLFAFGDRGRCDVEGI